MATTKKKTNAPVKRFMTEAELKRIGKLWHPLTRCVYEITESPALNPTAKKEILAFYKGLLKARQNFGIAQASGYRYDSFPV